MGNHVSAEEPRTRRPPWALALCISCSVFALAWTPAALTKPARADATAASSNGAHALSAAPDPSRRRPREEKAREEKAKEEKLKEEKAQELKAKEEKAKEEKLKEEKAKELKAKEERAKEEKLEELKAKEEKAKELKEKEEKAKEVKEAEEKTKAGEAVASGADLGSSQSAANPPVSPPATPAPAMVPSTEQAPSSAAVPVASTHPRLHARRQQTAPAGESPGGAVPAAPAAKPLPVSGAVPAAATATSDPKHTHGGAHSGPMSGADQSTLVRTVTKIVGVVPALVRVLIGALVALGLALAVGSRLVALRARRLVQQRSQLLEDVGLLQAALLPVLPARLGPVATSAAYRPAAGPAAGGDFYDVFALEDGQLAIIVGDVSGHGRKALPHTALVRFTLRAYLEAGMSPRSALQTAAAVLERQLGGSFVTVVAATYHPRDRVLVYACAGHPPPLVVGSQPMTAITACSSPPIGAGLPTGMRQTVVSLPGRSLVCFYTDGVIEARVGQDLYGTEALAHALAELGPNATAAALLDRVAEESDRRPDDMAACLLQIEGGEPAPAVQVEELELDRREAAGDRAERFLLACGVNSGEIGEVIRSARLTTERIGNVVVELHVNEGAPEIALRRDNVAFLHAGAREPASTVGRP